MSIRADFNRAFNRALHSDSSVEVLESALKAILCMSRGGPIFTLASMLRIQVGMIDLFEEVDIQNVPMQIVAKGDENLQKFVKLLNTELPSSENPVITVVLTEHETGDEGASFTGLDDFKVKFAVFGRNPEFCMMKPGGSVADLLKRFTESEDASVIKTIDEMNGDEIVFDVFHSDGRHSYYVFTNDALVKDAVEKLRSIHEGRVMIRIVSPRRPFDHGYTIRKLEA